MRSGWRPFRPSLESRYRRTYGPECFRSRPPRPVSRVSRLEGVQDNASRRHPQRDCPLAPWKAGLTIHGRFGKLPWRTLFADAIAFAMEGFPVAEMIAEIWADPPSFAKIQSNPESARIFLPDGMPPREGDLFRNPDMARAFRLIAEEGPAAFYKGEIATAILKTSQSEGGTLTAGDLAGFASEWVEGGPFPIEPTAAGASQKFLRTARASPPSRC